MVVYAYNPSYLEGRDWEDGGLRLAQAKSSQDLISTNKSWAWWQAPLTPDT
jgi:hypothetical protein